MNPLSEVWSNPEARQALGVAAPTVLSEAAQGSPAVAASGEGKKSSGTVDPERMREARRRLMEDDTLQQPHPDSPEDAASEGNDVAGRSVRLIG
mgnify:CR=1 FL=1